MGNTTIETNATARDSREPPDNFTCTATTRHLEIATMYDKLNQLTESHGQLRPGHGLVTGVVAFVLATLCFLGVLAFHFPEYLTTPQLRKSYNVELMRQLLYWALVISGGVALFNIVLGRARWLSAGAFVLIGLSLALGGHKVPVNDFPDNTPYIGLDWFILDLLGSTLIFIFIEKLFPLRRDQPVFRPEWQTDFHHFLVNHMVVGFVLLATNLLVHKLFGWATKDGVQAWVQALPTLPAVPTLDETPGFKGLDVVSWTGVFVPARTPAPIVERLNAEINEVLKIDEVRGKLADGGALVGSGNAAAFGRFVLAEQARFEKIAKAANIKE